MNKNYFKNKKIGRRLLTLSLCFLLIASTTTSILGVTPNSTIKEQTIKHSIETESIEKMTYTFSFQKPKLKETTILGSSFSKINIPGTLEMGAKTGEPLLPVKPIKILLPPQKTIKNIQVTGTPIELDVKTEMLQEKPIQPHQQSVPLGKDITPKLQYNDAFYQKNENYPKIKHGEHHIGYCRGYTIFDVGINPIQYNPGEQKIYYHTALTVTLELEEAEQMNPFYRNNINDKEWVQNLVINPDMIESYKNIPTGTTTYNGGLCDPIDDYDYVIILRNSLYDFSGTTYNWDDFILRKQADGLTAIKVKVEDITSCSDYFNSNSLFNDTPAKIREFCKDAYQDWGTEYVLVAGDQDGSAMVQRRLLHYGTGYDQENVESDLYWSNLDNTFNSDLDSQWGESDDAGFDLYSELFIGSLPCDTPTDLSNWMTKSFYYADSTFKDYLDNAAFYGGDTGWECQGDDFIEYSALQGTNDWLGPNPHNDGPFPTWIGFQFGFETWNSHNPYSAFDLSVKWTGDPPNPGWQGGSESAAITGLKNAINNDQVTLISAIAHANAGMSMDVYDSSWESNYHNTRPFFLHDFGCHCGDMDDADDGVLHSMLFHDDTELAFGCVYNTGYGWGNLGSTNSSSSLQQKAFWDYMFDTVNNSGTTMNWQLGKAQAWSKDLMAPTIDWDPGYETWRGIIESCLLFADPAQRIKSPMQPDHNVGVQDFDVSAHEPADTDIIVTATVYNNGKNDETNVEVRYLVDGVEQDSTIIPLLQQSSTEQVQWMYHTPANGWETHTVNITMVPGENISVDNVKHQDVIYGPDIAVIEINAPSRLGQGFGKPVSGYIENLGPTDETVTINFYANDILENTTDIYLTSGEGSWVSFWWDATNSGLGTYDLMIYAEPVANEYYVKNQNKTSTVSVFSALGSILLVDDDEGDAYESYYTTALEGANYVYDIWNRGSQGSPIQSDMSIYTAVIWFTGDDYTSTLDSSDQTNLANYLDAGGRLFITGQDIGYEIHSDSFYSNYLHASYNTDDTGIVSLIGVDDDEIGDGLSFGISSGDGANNQDWPDGISAISPAEVCFEYVSSSHDAAVYVEENDYRIVYFGFGFEAINNQDDRTEIMSRVLGWLGLEHEIEVLNLDVDSVLPHGTPVDITSLVRNRGLNNEQNIMVNFTVDEIVLDSTIIATLDSGQSTYISFPWNPEIGLYSVGIEASTVPGEESTANNAVFKQVEVIADPDINVDTENMEFNQNEGETSSDIFNIENDLGAEAPLNFEISYGMRDWLSVLPTEGTVPIGGNMDITVYIDSTGLSEGTYYKNIIIDSDDLDEPIVTIPVELTVVFEDDFGGATINHPTGITQPGLITINATIENYGSMPQTDILVTCDVDEEGQQRYSAQTTVSISEYQTEYVEFIPAWDAMPGDYEITITTQLTGDQDPSNDQVTDTVTIIATCDAGALGINHPYGDMIPDYYTINTNIRNCGTEDQNIPVKCSIYNELETLVFESDIEVFIPALTTTSADFTEPWPATPAQDYEIKVETLLTDDYDDRNNVLTETITILPYSDVGTTTITHPVGDGYALPTTVSATVENHGDAEQQVTVNCSIYQGSLGYFEDFELDEGGFIHAGENESWQWGTPTHAEGPQSAHSGSSCWGTDLDGMYINFTSGTLDSIPFFLPSDIPAKLTFWQWYITEPRYDGGNIKISTDSGQTWSLLGSYLDPYNEDSAANGNQGIPNEPCFSGRDQQTWEQITFDLSDYAGEEVIIRWHFGSDRSIVESGWYIDDIAITELNPNKLGSTKPVYTSEIQVTIPSLSTMDVDFPNPWQATVGSYAITVTTNLPGDEDSGNDRKTAVVTLEQAPYICGDANFDQQVNVGDAVYLINYVFKGGPAPTPELCVGDANGDGEVNVGDAVYLINYVFKGGPPPVLNCCEI